MCGETIATISPWYTRFSNIISLFFFSFIVLRDLSKGKWAFEQEKKYKNNLIYDAMRLQTFFRLICSPVSFHIQYLFRGDYFTRSWKSCALTPLSRQTDFEMLKVCNERSAIDCDWWIKDIACSGTMNKISKGC